MNCCANTRSSGWNEEVGFLEAAALELDLTAEVFFGVAAAFTVFAAVFTFAFVLVGRAFAGGDFLPTDLEAATFEGVFFAGTLDLATGLDWAADLDLAVGLDLAAGLDLVLTFALADFTETFFKAFGAALGEGFKTFFLAGEGSFFAISVSEICERVMGRETWGRASYLYE